MIDSMMTPWKPIGPVLVGKSGAVRRALPRTGPATDYSMMYSPYKGHGVESWSQIPTMGSTNPAVRVSP